MTKSKTAARRARRVRRHARIAKKVRGTEERPRLVVYRSLQHTGGQLVDDDRGITLVGVSTHAPEVREAEHEGRVQASFEAGKLLAERARAMGVERVVFDRAGFKYHGRVKAFAEGAREGGLEF